MLQGIVDFFNFLGVNPFWPALVTGLSVVLAGVSTKELKYKIEEATDKEGKKTYKIFKYR